MSDSRVFIERDNKIQKKSLQPRKKRNVAPDERLSKLDKFYKDIQVMIMMTDDEEELLLLAPLLMTTAKNIMVSTMGAKKTKLIFSQFCDDIKVE